jgi:proteasome lid subunit RPN8/RPN11
MNPLKEIILAPDHMDQMQAHVSHESPLEACGLIGGINGRSLEVFPVDNILQSPFRFQIDPQEQLRLFNILEDRRWDLLAMYHSHPKGPDTPSDTDISEASYPDAVNLIWSKQYSIWRCNAFIIAASQYHEIQISLVAGM